jgi:uroporphyrinogen decarboxylase
MHGKHTSHRERLENCIAGVEVDRPPAAFWRHFPVDDQTPEGLASSTIAFQRDFDFDLVKVTPASSYCLKDWGILDRWAGNPEGTRDYLGPIIQKPEDWGHLQPLNPKLGWLAGQLACLHQINQEVGSTTPILQTIFSPLAQAKNLVGGNDLLVHLRTYPEAVHAGLRTITETTLRFIEECVKTGISGIFYAQQHAQYGLLSESEFDQFGRAYDLKVLEAVNSLWCNMLHLHGENVMFDRVADYPVAIINWHDRQTSPSLSQALNRFPGVLCGGLRQWETMTLGTPQKIKEEAQEALTATEGKRLILGTGCVLPVIVPCGNIQAALQAAQNQRG